MVNVVLAHGPQLQWSTLFREEAKIIEQWSKARDMEISQDQILGGDCVTIVRQSIYIGHILSLCHVAALNAWDRIEEVRKQIETFTKVI